MKNISGGRVRTIFYFSLYYCCCCAASDVLDMMSERVHLVAERSPHMVIALNDSTPVFVAISVSAVSKFNARSSDYLEAAVLTALNWKYMGFTPILLIITGMRYSVKAEHIRHELYETHSIQVEIIKVRHSFVYVAQRCRMAAAHFLNAREGFLRLTDADMLVGNGKAFGAYAGGVHVFNGLCCRTEFPMHSIGMSLALWRQYFNASLCYPGNSTQIITHSGAGWTGDQQYISRIILEDMKKIPLRLSPGPRCRLHPHESLSKCEHPDDLHLAGFTIKSNIEWVNDACTRFNLTSSAYKIEDILRKINNQSETELARNSTFVSSHE